MQAYIRQVRFYYSRQYMCFHKVQCVYATVQVIHEKLYLQDME